MASNPPSAQQTDRPAIHLVGLSIYLSNPNINPSLVNPDFLRHNGIVEPTWTVMRPVIIDHGYSRIRYSNGLVFTAGNDHVIISQHAITDEERNAVTPLTREDVVCFSAASRYLESVSPVSPYDFMSIDPVAWIEIDPNVASSLASPLKGLAARIPVEEEVPEVQVRAQYSISGKTATIYVSEVNPEFEDNTLRILFSGEIIHDLEDEDQNGTSADAVAEILGKWEEDIGLFHELVYRLYSTYVPEEQ